MSLIAKTGGRSSLIPLGFNTGTIIDYSVCKFVKSYDDKHWLVDGGLSFTNGWAGRYQRFKSTIAVALAVKSLEKYPESSIIMYDTELSLRDMRRFAEMSDLYRDDPVKRQAHIDDIVSRIVVYNITQYPTLDDFLGMVKDVYYKAIDDNRKELTVDTPFPDPLNPKKPRKSLIPTYIIIDSLSQAVTRAAHVASMDNDISSSKQNMVPAADGRAKNTMLSRMVYDAAAYGIVWITTAQINNAIDLSGRGLPRAKDIQFMRQDDQIKSCGGKYLFLMSSLFVNEKASVQQTANKECQYPYSRNQTKADDISELKMKLIRDKTKGAGDDIYPIMSQSRGFDTGLTYYNIIKQSKFAGITDPTKVQWGTVFDPEDKAQRTTVALKCAEDYKFFRSLEIIAQLLYMQKNLSTSYLGLPTDISPEKLAEKLAKATYAISDILATRSWWSYGFEEIPYMSLLDMLEIVKSLD